MRNLEIDVINVAHLGHRVCFSYALMNVIKKRKTKALSFQQSGSANNIQYSHWNGKVVWFSHPSPYYI